MKRVAILHFSGPPVIGGVESTIYHHARLLAQAGFSVEVIAGRGECFHAKVAFQRIPEIDSRHPEVLSAGEHLAQGQVAQVFLRLRDQLALQLRAILSKVDVCIVHNALTLHKNMPLTAALHTLASERLASWIAWCHDFSWQDQLYTPDLHAGYPWDLLRTPWPNVKYVVVSDHRRKRLSDLLGIPADDIQVVNPGVDIVEFQKLAQVTRKIVERLDLLSAEPLVLLPARITRRKNIEFAIRVMESLSGHKPLATLVITGPPGPHNPKNAAYLETLKSLRQKLGLEKRVHFLYELGEDGQPLNLPDEVIADFYQLADILLFPSRHEGFGIPVLEAGLARLPIFAADIPSIRESAGHLAHLFDPEGDPGVLGNAICAYLDASQTYQMRRRVYNHYTWDAVVNQRLIPLIQESSKS